MTNKLTAADRNQLLDVTKSTVFAEAFRQVTGQDPTPALVAQAMKDPGIKHQIDETMEVIEELREQEDDDDEDESNDD